MFVLYQRTRIFFYFLTSLYDAQHAYEIALRSYICVCTQVQSDPYTHGNEFETAAVGDPRWWRNRRGFLNNEREYKTGMKLREKNDRPDKHAGEYIKTGKRKTETFTPPSWYASFPFRAPAPRPTGTRPTPDQKQYQRRSIVTRHNSCHRVISFSGYCSGNICIFTAQLYRII